MGYNTFKKHMMKLWMEHIIFTREVIIASVLRTQNLNDSFTILLENQTNIGNQLIDLYGETIAFEYTKLLKEHINLAVNIVTLVLAKKDTKDAITEWYDNATRIATFLNETTDSIKYDKIYGYMEEHLNCTLNEALFLIKKDWINSALELNKCIKIIQHMTSYLADKLYKE